jgi:ribosomal protein S21
MIEVRKRDRESAEGLIRRFNKRIQQSRVLAKARKSRFRLKVKSKIKKREEAVYKVRIRKEIVKLKKFGKFDDETLKEIKRKMGS